MSIEERLAENTAALTRLAEALEKANGMNERILSEGGAPTKTGSSGAGNAKPEKPAVQKAASAPKETPPAPTQPTATEPAAPPQKDDNSAPPSFDTVKALFLELGNTNMSVLESILKKHGATRLSNVPQESLAAFYADMKAAA